MDEQERKLPSAEDFLLEEPLLEEELAGPMPELTLDIQPEPMEDVALDVEPEAMEDVALEAEPEPMEDLLADMQLEPALDSTLDVEPEPMQELTLDMEPESDFPVEEAPEPETLAEELPVEIAEEIPEADILQEVDALLAEETSDPEDYFYRDLGENKNSVWDAPVDERDPFFGSEKEPIEENKEETPSRSSRPPRKGRPKRKKGYGLLGLPHLAATVIWLAIIVMIGTSLGRMLWVCAADVLAFGRESKQVTVTITSKDTIDDIAEKLREAGLIRYPQVFKLYAKLAVDDGDILPGTFQLDTLYDYHALVVQMGPRSSTREVVYDLLIPEGLNCRQIFELLEQNNVCTVEELEEYAASGEFAEFWFLDGVERGDKYCLEGFLFPDTYDFYMGSTPREALGKMLLGFEARVDQEKTMTALNALNERLSAMMRSKGCSEDHIAENQLELRDLLTVASLIEEETASSKESPLIASVIFNRLTEDQMYERYLNIDAAIIYATGDANNIDTSIDHPYNTYKNAGLTPGPISNPGLESIYAVLEFEDSPYYYYVLNPETDVHQFSKTLEEHEKWVEEFRNYTGGDEG